jgi:hypothetical protein
MAEDGGLQQGGETSKDGCSSHAVGEDVIEEEVTCDAAHTEVVENDRYHGVVNLIGAIVVQRTVKSASRSRMMSEE